MTQLEKLDLRSHDAAGDKIAELLRLFPEIRTEGGTLDFDRLKLALGEAVDVGKERYGMNWPGKADCFKTIQAPSLGTLRPCAEESVNFDTTENQIIEGDNLEVLKLLQKSYLGRVKMIYIDHIRDGRTQDDILYELLLKSGFPLTTPVEKQTLAGKTIYSVAGGALVICLERQLTLDLIRAVAEKKPERVVCLDSGFAGNDQLKANAVQIFKTKGVTSFKTV
jgi:hypothetical protein